MMATATDPAAPYGVGQWSWRCIRRTSVVLLLAVLTTVATAWLAGGLRIGPFGAPSALPPILIVKGAAGARLVFTGRSSASAGLTWRADDGYRQEDETYLELELACAEPWLRRALRRTPEDDSYRAAGWPALALEMTAHDRDPAMWVFDHEYRGGFACRLDWRGRLVLLHAPCTPIWGGFVINSLLYAGIWVVLLYGPGWNCRTRRRRRGCCAACGYPAGMSGTCTECGAALPFRRRRGRIQRREHATATEPLEGVALRFSSHSARR